MDIVDQLLRDHPIFHDHGTKRFDASPATLGANATWDEKTLDEYLQGPGKFVKGTRMVYFVPDEKDRQDIIAYLKTLAK